MGAVKKNHKKGNAAPADLSLAGKFHMAAK
jgi:hypothetical protein